MASEFAAGNYRFIPAVFQYSSGAQANAGYEIERVRFDRLVPLAEGFARIAAYIKDAGRPLTSFCACELRSPAAFTEDGFRAFNQHYVKTLAEWGLFDDTIDEGGISAAAMFSTAYQPIPGTDPQQYLTAYTELCDRLLPPIQEAVLRKEARIDFCVAVDRNGYLPTHNLKYSQPQRPGEPAWNAANCRNRRLFDDFTGIAAARSRAPALVQTYRRDMGGGKFLLMKDVSAPVLVHGRHWGALRLGCRPT